MTEPAKALAPAAVAEELPDALAASTAGSTVARNALHLVVGQVALTALSFVLNGALGRALGPAEFGVFFFVLSATNFAYTLVDWGQSHVLIREVARHRERTGTLLGSAAAIRVVGAVVAALVTAPVLWALGYDLRTVGLTSLYILIWIPSTIWMAYGMAFRGHERMDADAKLSVVNKVLNLAIVLPVLALGGRLVIVFLGVGAAGAGALVYAKRLSRKVAFPPLQAPPGEIRWLLSAGAPLVVTNVLMMAQPFMEPLMLSMMTSEHVLGWYGAARTIANALIMPASIIATASFPRIARASARTDDLRREFTTAMRPVVALSALVGAGTWAFAPVATSLVYGAEGFGGAATILRAIAPTLSLMFVNMVLANTVLVAGQAKRVAAFKVVALALSAGLAYWLVPVTQEHWANGAIGVIVAFAVSETFMLVVFLCLAPKGVLERRFWLDLVRSLAAATLALASLRAVPGLHPLLAMPGFVLLFAAVGLGVGLFSREDMISFAGAIVGSRRSSKP